MSEEWLSITDAAARLTASGDPIDRTSLSRYVKRYRNELKIRPDRLKTFVELVGLKDHRNRNTRIRPALDEAERARMFAGASTTSS